MPVCEAMEAGLPVVCSTAPMLPSLVRDAALLFEPTSVEEIASAIARLYSDAGLLAELSQRGRERAKSFSRDTTWALFRAHYRRLAGAKLSATDANLLAQPSVV